jgi:hydrogenase nickel incorporation protein HypA/HybF
MHELSLCESIVKIIEKQAQRDGFSRVLRVTLSIGEQAGVSTESLAFCFPMVAKDTVANGAELLFNQTEGSDLRVSELEVSTEEL